MRLLYICNEYPPAMHGGIGIFVRALAEGIVAAGHEAAVIGYASHVRTRSESLENGVRVFRLPWPQTGGLVGFGRWRHVPSAILARKALSRDAARLARQFRPDLVESHDWSAPLWSAPWRPLVVRLHGASAVCASFRGRKAGRLMWFLERRNLRIADSIVAASRYIGQATLKVLGLPEKPFTALYHGIDTERFRPGLFARDSREVLFGATLKTEKGIEDLFRAIPRVLQSHPEARFTIAGRQPKEASHPCSPQSLLRTLPPHLQPAVRFLGHVTQTELASLYTRAAVAVFPSHGEAFGLSCAEAMACGAPVVMTVRGSGPELVEHGRSGWLVEPTDTEALAAAITRLLRDPELRMRLGAEARATVLEKFNLSDALTRNIAFYEQAVSRHTVVDHLYQGR